MLLALRRATLRLLWRVETRCNLIQLVMERSALGALLFRRHDDVGYLHRRRLARQREQFVHGDPGSDYRVAYRCFADFALYVRSTNLCDIRH